MPLPTFTEQPIPIVIRQKSDLEGSTGHKTATGGRTLVPRVRIVGTPHPAPTGWGQDRGANCGVVPPPGHDIL